MHKSREMARKLAEAMLQGRLEPKGMRYRVKALVGRRAAWPFTLVRRVLQNFGREKRPRAFDLTDFIEGDRGFQRAWVKHRLGRWTIGSATGEMSPAGGRAEAWDVPAITTVAELAILLNLRPNELRWFASQWGERGRTEERLRHYRYRWQEKRDGSLRLIEAPKQRLKFIQRYIAHEILERIPPHRAAHGFRKERSILSFARPHTQKSVVLKLDLKDFFPRIRKSRVGAIFRTAGYPATVANALAGLCTTSVPAHVIESAKPIGRPSRHALRALYGQPHLPQGGPTSPALANLSAYRLDCRLAGLAAAVGADYTRYADDLVFSGGAEFARGIERFYIKGCAIALEEGFEVNTRKTRLMRRSVSQKAAGIVLNDHPNIGRTEYDQLKAVLHNCVKTGPDEQNRANVPDFRAHLLGRIAHVRMVHPGKGKKLLKSFGEIVWLG